VSEVLELEVDHHNLDPSGARTQGYLRDDMPVRQLAHGHTGRRDDWGTSLAARATNVAGQSTIITSWGPGVGRRTWRSKAKTGHALHPQVVAGDSEQELAHW